MPESLREPLPDPQASARALSSPISLEQAVAIFDQLADREDIAFGYASDGCYARAHLMCEAVSAIGLKPKKAWAFEGEKSLSVELPGGGNANWWFHVTLALPVKMPNGDVQDLVFDPALFDGPVTLREWGAIMQAPPEYLQIKPFGKPPDGYKGSYLPSRNCRDPDVDSKQTMQDYLPLQFTSRMVFSSQFCQGQAFQGQTQQQAARRGKSWVSLAYPPAQTLQDFETTRTVYDFRSIDHIANGIRKHFDVHGIPVDDELNERIEAAKRRAHGISGEAKLVDFETTQRPYEPDMIDYKMVTIRRHFEAGGVIFDEPLVQRIRAAKQRAYLNTAQSKLQAFETAETHKFFAIDQKLDEIRKAFKTGGVTDDDKLDERIEAAKRRAHDISGGPPRNPLVRSLSRIKKLLT